jgi:hypothetical protein
METERRPLWFALVGLSIGASLLHVRIHPPDRGHTYLFANLFAWLDLFVVSGLFLSRRTAVWGLLLNSFIAFLGIILMADFTVVATLTGKIKVSPADDLVRWLLQTTLPDIAIAFADFLVGLGLYRALRGPGRGEGPVGV